MTFERTFDPAVPVRRQSAEPSAASPHSYPDLQFFVDRAAYYDGPIGLGRRVSESWRRWRYRYQRRLRGAAGQGARPAVRTENTDRRELAEHPEPRRPLAVR